MRQHVNPLSSFFQSIKDIPEPETLFENGGLPIHLDIGCARGKFLLAMASSNKQSNFLGIEIRESLVDAAEKERIELGLNNLKFLFCNANVSLNDWFKNIKGYPVTTVSIQFPDPWFKNRHKKRKVLNDSLVALLARNLDKGSTLFLQTDVLCLMEDMINTVDNSMCFDSNKVQLNLLENPFNFPTEREKYAIKKGILIFRKIYTRNQRNAVSNN